MSDYQAPLKNFKSRHDFFIAIDSDGCAFDTMEIKHKECFIPNIIKHWNLQPVSKFARAAAEFVNLYSQWRVINRFPALVRVFDLLLDWPEAMKRNPEIPSVQSLRHWIDEESKLGNPALEKKVEKKPDAVLSRALEWSKDVNKTVGEMVHDIPPFPFVRESLESVYSWADIIVCSATPEEALIREWQEHDIADFTEIIAGQEMGSKTEHIHLASENKYDKNNMLMIGDAPGDMKAAKANNAYFYPINPGHEDESWERFFKEAADKFKNGEYGGDYEASLIEKFQKSLPSTPPWKN